MTDGSWRSAHARTGVTPGGCRGRYRLRRSLRLGREGSRACPVRRARGDLRDDPDLRAVVAEAIDRANTLVSRAETIKRFAILPGSFEVGAELTPTQKVRRHYVLDKYADSIDALYAAPGS